MFDNDISSSLASNSDNDGPSENDVEGTSRENTDSIFFSTALFYDEEEPPPRDNAEEEDDPQSIILSNGE
uniref:Uncharacterized protein n=1 Tax=Panagrolaimus sp. ES5 TaxID=591445 RepID=A0AC34G5A4_9BILA